MWWLIRNAKEMKDQMLPTLGIEPRISSYSMFDTSEALDH